MAAKSAAPSAKATRRLRHAGAVAESCAVVVGVSEAPPGPDWAEGVWVVTAIGATDGGRWGAAYSTAPDGSNDSVAAAASADTNAPQLS